MPSASRSGRWATSSPAGSCSPPRSRCTARWRPCAATTGAETGTGAAGTLFLDNPIGRANATYLLELQRAVSDALGVQLLYTTGLFDTTALAEFPLVIRLRNDADLRAGLKYISVEEHLRPGLPQQDPEGETVHGEITATRMFKRTGGSGGNAPAAAVPEMRTEMTDRRPDAHLDSAPASDGR